MHWTERPNREEIGMANEFSVYQYLGDEMMQEKVRDHVSAEEAVKAAEFYTNNVAAKLGITRRVIITDGGDSLCFEWKQGEGVTFK